jgi:hypothetical protein
MDEETRKIYERLEKKLKWLHYYWQLYRQLYGNSSVSIEVLNGVAPSEGKVQDQEPVVANPHTLPALVEGMIRWVNRQKGGS